MNKLVEREDCIYLFHEGQECQVEIRGFTAFCFSLMLGNTADCHAVDRVWNFDLASNFWKHHFLLVSPESAWKIEHGENLQTELQKNMGPFGSRKFIEYWKVAKNSRYEELQK